MDRLEKWYKDNRADMDQLEVRPEMWDELAEKLTIPQTKNWYQKSWLKWSGAGVIVVLLGISFAIFNDIQVENHPMDMVDQRIPTDISLMSPEGEKISLSSLKGKVILLEFWASWCNHCQEYNCNNLLPIYDEYKDMGFEIYAVSLDRDSTSWVVGIQRDQLPGVHVSDLQGYASPVSQMYGIERTPTTFLLDENMNVIGKNLTREELERKLYECYFEEE